MNIGLYFGSFNPIHNGHCIIANYVAHHTNLDQVWFIVSPQNPFKSPASLLNEYHRLHLVKLAIETEIKLKAMDIEFNLPKPSYTVDTLAYLTEKYPQHSFSIIMGSDSFQNIHKWKNAAVIIKNYDIYVYPRPGFEVKNELSARVIEVAAPLLQISSTQIREFVRNKKPIRFFVPDAVNDEIARCGYYKQ